ncbi:MAG: cytochrome c [Saccharospirillaceae bacterium]|nr:cytochrome c [Saccharospirillaceae bacterium]MCD8533196.1 cytochrome c [Saccharospirillaceae bacterium]
MMVLKTFTLSLLTVSALGAALAAPVSAAGATENNGEALFNQRCAACHQPGGIGTPGLAPPLVNSLLWPALAEQAPAYFWGVLNNGLSGTIEVDGIGYYGLVMPAQADLTAEQMKALAAYVLGDLNGLNAVLSDEVLEQARSTPQSHSQLRGVRKNAQ